MKKLILILTLPLLLAACQSNSYYKAMNTNEQRFDGWQEENAVWLNETHDLALLVSDLSGMAQKKANLKETYLLAEKVQEMIEETETDYKIESTILRVKLASSLSDKSDTKLHKLEDISEENFDAVYLRYVRTSLEEMKDKSAKYNKEGHNKRLRDFADQLENTVDNILEELDGAKIS
ncbi:MAG: DUF4142 domain-containing protein [Marinoscillum sp.]